MGRLFGPERDGHCAAAPTGLRPPHEIRISFSRQATASVPELMANRSDRRGSKPITRMAPRPLSAIGFPRAFHHGLEPSRSDSKAEDTTAVGILPPSLRTPRSPGTQPPSHAQLSRPPPHSLARGVQIPWLAVKRLLQVDPLLFVGSNGPEVWRRTLGHGNGSHRAVFVGSIVPAGREKPLLMQLRDVGRHVLARDDVVLEGMRRLRTGDAS